MSDWVDSIEARARAQPKYEKTNTVGFYMKLNIHINTDIIQWLWGQPSKQGAVERLIREEIARMADEKEPAEKRSIHPLTAV